MCGVVGESRVAVVGGGVAGLTAAYLLRRRCRVTLFEAEDRLGGHAHTHELISKDGGLARVDTGFIVHNPRTYPNLVRLFAELGVATRDTEMSMSVRCAGCGLRYAGARGPRGLFPAGRTPLSRSNLVRPRYLRMLAEVPRFHRRARALLADPTRPEQPLGDFLAEGGFSAYFVEHFALPLVSAVWSAGPAPALGYPARYLFQFLAHHGLLSVGGSPRWRTVVGGSQEYVRRLAKALTEVAVSPPVRAVRRVPGGGVGIRDDGDVERRFDRVVIAVHPDQALALLAEPSEVERAVLGAFRYSTNPTWLHSDTSVLPDVPGAAASWNYFKPSCASRAGAPVLVSYDMNRLQGLAGATRYVVTLSPNERVDPGLVLARMSYRHPLYTTESIRAQARLPELNTATTVYAGAYHGWGFHEDGCASGVRAAAWFGVDW